MFKYCFSTHKHINYKHETNKMRRNNGMNLTENLSLKISHNLTECKNRKQKLIIIVYDNAFTLIKHIYVKQITEYNAKNYC